MPFHKVTRMPDRYISEWRLIKTPYKNRPMTLDRWRELNARNPSAATSLVIDARRLIEITKVESWAIDATDDWVPVATKYQPRAERGGIWWLVGKHDSGRDGVATYDTASKNLEINDVWEGTEAGIIKWYPNGEVGIETARIADVMITRSGADITKVERK